MTDLIMHDIHMKERMHINMGQPITTRDHEQSHRERTG